MDQSLNHIGNPKFLIEVEISIHTLTLSIPDEKLLKLTWEKHKKHSETPEFIISSSSPSISIQSSLVLSKTFYTKNSEYLPKPIKINLKQKLRNSWVSLSTLTLDLSQYLQTPLIQKDFFLDLNGQTCKINLSINQKNSKSEPYSLEQNLLDTREKFEEVLTEYNDNLEDVENLKKDVEKLITLLEEAKKNRNESYLLDKQ